MATRTSGQSVLALLLAGAAGWSAACGPGEPRTDAERLARGREIIEAMSTRIGGAQTFTVTVSEKRQQLKSNGQTEPVSLVREMTIRRPDRMYVRTTGDLDNEVWYDGVGVTLVLHKEKAFAQARMPETLDKTLDAMHERYGIATPLADFAYTEPAKALLTPTTTGGWVARETVDGQETDHLAFKDTGVSWEAWIATTGDRLPVKAVGEFPESTRFRHFETTFTNWNLAPELASDRFTPKVGPDYEGIAILQRARVLRNVKDEDTPAAEGEKK